MSAIRALRAIRPATLSTTISATPARTFTVSALRAQSDSRTTAPEDNTPQTSATTSQSGDAFQKREQASENMYIQKQLQEKLDKLRAQVKDAESELTKSSKK